MFTRRTVITYEKLERSFYRLAEAEPVTAECDACGCTVNWLTPPQATAITGLSLREIFRRIETDQLHFSETSAGLLFICPNSLSSYQDSRGV